MDDFGTIWEGEYAVRKQSKSGARKGRSNRNAARTAPVAGDFDAVRSMEFPSSKASTMNREVPASFRGSSRGSSRTGDRYYYHSSTSNVHNMYDEVFAASISTIPAFEDVFNSARVKLSELRDNDIFRAFRRIPGTSRVSYEDVFRCSPDRSSGLLIGSKLGTSSSRGSSSGRQSPAAQSGVVKRESTEGSRSFRESPKASNLGPDSAPKMPVLGSFLSMSGTYSRQGPPDGPEVSRSSSSQRKSEPERQGSVKKDETRSNKDWVTVGDVGLITKSTENPPPARSAPPLEEDMSESPTLETTREASGPPPVRVPPALGKGNMLPEAKEPSHTRAHSLERILKDRSMQAGESIREKVLAWQMHSLVEQELDNPRRTMSLDRERTIGNDLEKEVTLFARLKAEVKHPFVVEPHHAGREAMQEENQVEEVEELETGEGADESSHEQENVQPSRAQKEEAAEEEDLRPSGAAEAEGLRSSHAGEAGLLSSRTDDLEAVQSSRTAGAEAFRSRPEVLVSGRKAESEALRSSPTPEPEVGRSSDTAEPSRTEEVEVAETPRSSAVANGEKSRSSEAGEAEKDPPSNDEETSRSGEAAGEKTEDQKNEGRSSASPRRRSTSSDKESSVGIDTISSISEDEKETKAKSTTRELHEDPAPETPERLENSSTYKKSEKSSSEEAIENAWKEEARKTAEAEAQQRSLVARIQAEVQERAAAAAKMKAEKAAKEAMVKAKAVERRTRPRLKEAIDNSSNVGGASASRLSLREQLEMERQLRSSSGVVEGGGKATLAEKITAEVRERTRSVERSRVAASRAEEQQVRQQQLQQQLMQHQLQQQQQQQREMQRQQRERLERERVQEKERLEKERLEKLQRERMERELEREREIEREKDRIGLEKKLNEEKARQEREAIAREQAAAAAAAAAVERARMERAAVERATSEARARAERAAYDKSSRSSSVPRHSVSMPSAGTSQAAEAAAAATIRRTTSSANLDSQSSSRDLQQKGETPGRMKARLERHQRTMDRQARALAQKNQRDLEIQTEQAERQRLAERLDTDIKRWSLGKDGNIRALLSTLQYVLWPDSGWKQVSLTELISSAAVKKAYRRAALCVHPDKMQQKNATVQQKYIADKVFHILQAAWNKFNSQETL